MGAPERESAAAERIRAAAIESFAKLGYAGTSTRQIAKRLNMSAAAMYPHFRSKEDLLYSIALEGHRGVLAAMRAADDPSQSYRHRLRSVVGAFTRWQAEYHELAKVVQYELHALSREHYRTIAAIRRQTTRLVADIVTGGVEAGEFAADDPADVVLAISSLCVDVSRWYPSREHRDPAALADAYATMAERMVQVR
ncbi:TetR/AcrR family transcriptional regulator [Gordonia sinesedis]